MQLLDHLNGSQDGIGPAHPLRVVKANQNKLVAGMASNPTTPKPNCHKDVDFIFISFLSIRTG